MLLPAKLAFTLNLRQYPPVDVLVNLCASPDEKVACHNCYSLPPLLTLFFRLERPH